MDNQNNNQNKNQNKNKENFFDKLSKLSKYDYIFEIIMGIIQGIGCLGELIIGFFGIIIFIITLCILKFCFHAF